MVHINKKEFDIRFHNFKLLSLPPIGTIRGAGTKKSEGRRSPLMSSGSYSFKKDALRISKLSIRICRNLQVTRGRRKMDAEDLKENDKKAYLIKV